MVYQTGNPNICTFGVGDEKIAATWLQRWSVVPIAIPTAISKSEEMLLLGSNVLFFVLINLFSLSTCGKSSSPIHFRVALLKGRRVAHEQFG